MSEENGYDGPGEDDDATHKLKKHAASEVILKTGHAHISNQITPGPTVTASTGADISPSFTQQVMEMLWEQQMDCSRSASVGDPLPPLVQFHQPEELQQLLPALGQPAAGQKQVLDICQKMALLSVRTGDFRFRNQLFGGVDEYGLAGALMSEMLNASAYTYEVAPVFTVCELAVLERMRKMIGWTEGDGITAPGGSISNQYALALARYRHCPDIKNTGLFGMKPLVVFTSQESHYSVMKAVNWHGYGLDNLVKVETDECGCMLPEALEAAVKKVIAEGRDPLMVNATGGSTVLGAYDPLPAVADICQKYGMWLHVDGAWGGAALLSKKHRHLLAGIERADSVSWNPHKILGAPLQCCLFVTRHVGLLHRCNSASASYLFQQDKFYNVAFDTGDKSIQCGRKVDAFKLWLMWHAHGDAGLERMVDGAFATASYCAEQVKHRPDFKPVLRPGTVQCANVCFWYVPQKLRGQQETEEWWEQVAAVAPKIKEGMMRQGTLMVGYQPAPYKNLVNFFRLVFTALPEVGAREVDYMLDEISRIGESL